VKKIKLGKIVSGKKKKPNSKAVKSHLDVSPFSQPLQRLSLNPSAPVFKYDWIVDKEFTNPEIENKEIASIQFIDISNKKKKRKKKKSKTETPLLALDGLLNDTEKDSSQKLVKNVEIIDSVEIADDELNTKVQGPQALANSENDSDTSTKTDMESKPEALATKPKEVKKKKPKAKKENNKKEDEETITKFKKEKQKSKSLKKSNKKKKIKVNKLKNSSVLSSKQRLELDDFTQWLNKMNGDVETFEKLEKVKSKSEKNKKGKKKFKKLKKKDKITKKIDNSVIKKDEIVSESLAELYIDQGFYKKAMKTYKKLSLINPEKSSFFAPLIEELKKKV